ncbi:hypothetical protein BaRGS_00032223 [Batillaria attramentaria]|uniref:Carboxylic ester hydrolase n=1 Tax=Batillaria attramentaria TaxID=370345 RepID=A0ABD0JNA0_9CAEN
MDCPVFSAILLCLGVSLASSAPVIDAPWGRVSGKDLTVAGGTASFYGYLGIPYALPPVGERRFARPQPHPGPGEGQVFNASSLGNACPQPSAFGLALETNLNEDCLTLNIYTPTTPSTSGDPYPVMVWIHGGAYYLGSAVVNTTPGRLVTQGDVIVVVIQYRLGILGFLSTADDASPGNYGLLDQNMAIRWVKDNIRAFGGDPDSITIFGESAGAGSVGLQMLSPYSKGLFSRAILQSGSPLASWSLNKSPREAVYKLANGTGCMDPGDAEPPRWVRWYSRYVDPLFLEHWTEKLHMRIVECLRGITVDKLLPFSTFVEDGFDVLAPESLPWDFVPREPAQLVLDPDYLVTNGIASRDVMHGVNNNEGISLIDLLTMAGGPDVDVDDDDIIDMLHTELRYQFEGDVSSNENAASALTDVLSFFYTQPRENGKINLQSVADIFSDISFVVPMASMLRSLSNSTATIQTLVPGSDVGSTYLYLFDHYPSSQETKLLRGMSHGSDLQYEFDDVTFSSVDTFTSVDVQLRDSFVAMVTEFAKTGNPNNAVGRQLNGTMWPEFSAADDSYLAFGPQPRVEKDLYAKRVALWLDLVPSLLNYTRGHDPTTSTPWWFQDGGRMRRRRPPRRYVNRHFWF